MKRYSIQVSFLVLQLCLSFSYGQIYTHDRKRPVPLLDSNHDCMQRFEVSENTIIRAQDSKKIGAKFINESDVGNREDCMALCCRTPLCSVAVFEEKVSK
mgnify:CR=1 FL=1